MITDHKNGSWTVTGYKDKKFLTKYLKEQGYKPHVHRKGDSRWSIGLSKDLAYKPKVRVQKAHKISHRQVAIRYQPRKSVSQGAAIGGRFVPLGRMRRYPSAYRRPNYAAGPEIRIPGAPAGGENFIKRRMRERAEQQKREQARIAQMKETDQKMRNERIAQERQEVAKQINDQEQTRWLQQERAQHEEEQRKHAEAQRMKQIRHEEFQSRRAHIRAQHQGEYEEASRKAALDSQFRPATEGLQRERENSILGG